MPTLIGRVTSKRAITVGAYVLYGKTPPTGMSCKSVSATAASSVAAAYTTGTPGAPKNASLVGAPNPGLNVVAVRFRLR